MPFVVLKPSGPGVVPDTRARPEVQEAVAVDSGEAADRNIR